MQEEDSLEHTITRHDGLLVDYSKFTNITKEVLKNANVVRAKNVRSPQKASGGSIYGEARNSYAFSPDSTGCNASQLAAFSIPPMSARIQTQQNGAARNHKIARKAPESPSLNIGRQIMGDSGYDMATKIRKSRPL